MNAEKLIVHDGSERQAAERLHARIVHALRVLVPTCARNAACISGSFQCRLPKIEDAFLTFELEGEVVGEVTALVVASEEKEGVWVPDLERPQVQHTLWTREGV